jgi:hypothetical protein
MFNRSISILATLAILACPMLCGANHHDGAAAEAPQAGCACCRRMEVPVDSAPCKDEAPDQDEQNGSEGCCQCICGGAVWEQVIWQQVDLSVGAWIVPATAETQTTLASTSVNRAARHLLSPDDGMNPGRRKCCLFMTFLC